MANRPSFLVLLGALLFLVNLVIGIPVIPVTEHALNPSGPDNDARYPLIIARDVVVRGALDDAVAAPIAARNVEIVPVKSSPFIMAAKYPNVHTAPKRGERDVASTDISAQRQGIEIAPSTDTTVHPWSGPYGTSVDIFDRGGWTGTSQRNLATAYDQCVNLAHWASGSVRSMGFGGATECFLYATDNCSGIKFLQVNADSPGVNITKGTGFSQSGPWVSFECGRNW